MSFFNESNSCQTSANPLNKIIDSTNIDHNNFHHIQTNQKIPQHIHQFKGVDRSLQNEYNTFTNSNQNFELNNHFVPNSIQTNNNLHKFQIQPQLESYTQIQGNTQQTNWVGEFNTLSIQETPNVQTQHPIQNFKQQSHRPLQYSSNIHMQSCSAIPLVHTSFATKQHESQKVQVQNSSTSLKELNNEFDNLFNEVENELKIDSQAPNPQFIEEEEDTHVSANDEEDKIKFAMLAQNVFNMMNNTPKNVSSNTSNKFKQSEFLQLMNKISNREIEISNDKKKLVDQNGVDIRNTLADPLSNLKKNDILETSFDSAIKVAQNSVGVTVDSSSWQSEFA